jgi:hypothetical protein
MGLSGLRVVFQRPLLLNRVALHVETSLVAGRICHYEQVADAMAWRFA